MGSGALFHSGPGLSTMLALMSPSRVLIQEVGECSAREMFFSLASFPNSGIASNIAGRLGSRHQKHGTGLERGSAGQGRTGHVNQVKGFCFPGRCCWTHDNCYHQAKRLPACRFLVDNPYTKSYKYSCSGKEITCTDDDDECALFICNCDRSAAICFAGAPYNKEYWKLDTSKYCK
ncbi:acidic phospholipase A2 HTe-like isoform X1 [Varanus komodoensis]|uniref:acidic phospholipase A2 HTe-like isoform X1 n=1 Tax=Varanus komodoensis TaxID=61221 RepID=UPI001CF7B7BB|nr:acidic phospholipase A2 HTe-like isoform X1 [Varanus komodoensis]